MMSLLVHFWRAGSLRALPRVKSAEVTHQSEHTGQVFQLRHAEGAVVVRVELEERLRGRAVSRQKSRQRGCCTATLTSLSFSTVCSGSDSLTSVPWMSVTSCSRPSEPSDLRGA